MAALAEYGRERAANRVMKTSIFTATLLALSLVAFGRNHTALNGTWVLEPTHSDFAGQPVIETGTVTINEREGDITVSRDFAYQGADKTYFYRDMVDSENNATIRKNDVKSKARWDHDVLKVETTRAGAVTTETYALAPDGTMKVNVVKPGSAPITLVFVRK
jgi:hypothetical protein